MIILPDPWPQSVNDGASLYINEKWPMLEQFSMEMIEATIDKIYETLSQYKTEQVRNIFNDSKLKEDRDLIFNYCVQLEVLQRLAEIKNPPAPPEPKKYGLKNTHRHITRIK